MKKRKKDAKKGEPQIVTRAITHIRLEATNAGKGTALDSLAGVYLELVQQYVTLFCTDDLPHGFRPPCFLTLLSERWHRNAIQQAAGIAKSWRSNRAHAYHDYLDALAGYQEQKADGTFEEGTKEPAWREWNAPTLRHPCLQANGNVVKLEEAADSTFDYWLKLSTLEKGHPLLLPVKLADYHQEQLTDPKTGKRRKTNNRVTLNKRDEVWWLTLTYDEVIVPQTVPEAPVIGIAVDRKNRPDQQTFCCRVCGHTAHADTNASENIASRLGDQGLRACQNRQEIKAVLLRRHEQWKQHFSLVVVQVPVQLGLWASSQASTDVG